MHYALPLAVCAYVHAIVVLFTLYHAARAPKRRLTLVLFALLEFSHGCGHYYSNKSGPWLWAYLHYTVIATAYSIKPAPLRVFVPFLCVDMIGHLVGNDILSIATTLTFSATRFDSNGMKLALAVTLVLFAFMESVLHAGMRKANSLGAITDRMALEQVSHAPNKSVFTVTGSAKYSALELTFVAGALESY